MSEPYKTDKVPWRPDRAKHENELFEAMQLCWRFDMPETKQQFIAAVHAFHNVVLSIHKSGIDFKTREQLMTEARRRIPQDTFFVTHASETRAYEEAGTWAEWDDCHRVLESLREKLAGAGYLIVLSRGDEAPSGHD